MNVGSNLLLACAAAWFACARTASRRQVRRRLLQIRWPAVDRRSVRPVASVPPSTNAIAPVLRFLGAVGSATVVLLVVGSTFGVAGALVIGSATWVLLGRLEPAAVRRRRTAVERDLAFAADLLAACLAAGAALDRALRVVGEALGGVVGGEFVRASAVLALGAPAHEAVAPWRLDPALEALEPVARTIVRTSTSGSALVASMGRLAEDLRSARRWKVDEVARRVGVRSAAPLGLCFLPAFVLLGIVPVVLSGAKAVGL